MIFRYREKYFTILVLKLFSFFVCVGRGAGNGGREFVSLK